MQSIPSAFLADFPADTTAAYTHNGQPTSAAAFYAIACDPRRSVTVEACAGAGKTWMLVSRMLRALLEGDASSSHNANTATNCSDNTIQPHEILAITFTKKAAGEMRERLYEWLAQFAHADNETLERELLARGVSPQVLGKAFAKNSDENSHHGNTDLRLLLSNLYQRVLDNGRPVQIRTFHSWFAALLRTAPLAILQRLGLPLNYELLEDDGPAKALVWRQFYAALVAAPALRADFEAVVMTYGRAQAKKALESALDKRTEFVLADAAGVVDDSVQHFSVQFAEFAALTHPDQWLSANPAATELLMDAAGVLGRSGLKMPAAKGAELEKALTSGNTAAVMASLLTQKNTPRKFDEKIAGIATVCAAQHALLRWLDVCTQHDAWQYHQRMARLARVLLAEFTALKREHSWVDMNDVERAAQVMLSDDVLSGWAQERLDARVRHLMIDEFQDTNPLQWQALYAWLSGYVGAGRAPSVFIVGDPKQSIYRFRRAEPQVFVAAQAFVRDGLGGDALACDHTRRNAVAVIGTVNAVMMAACASDGYEGFRPHTSASAEPGCVLRLPPIPRQAGQTRECAASTTSTAENCTTPAHELNRENLNPTEPTEPTVPTVPWRDSLTTPRQIPEQTLGSLEARQAAHWIAAHLASAANCLVPANVMVLSRRRAGLVPLQRELRALNIPAQVGEKTQLIDCCEVLDIVALLDVLVSPQHNLSLARALRSPLFGVSNDALVQLALAAQSAPAEAPLSWFEALQKTEQQTPETLAVAACLTQYKSWVDSLPPHDALQAIYHHGNVLVRFAAAAPAVSRSTVLANLRALLGAALECGGGRYATPYAFVRALKAGGLQAPAAVDPHAVRLLTIHGAKGLEAHTVVLLDTDTAERPPDTMGALVDWPGACATPQKFAFLTSETRPPACAKQAVAAEQLARKREELNALYVGLTRARNTLVVSSVTPYRTAAKSWWQRLHALTSAVAVPEKASTEIFIDPRRSLHNSDQAVAVGLRWAEKRLFTANDKAIDNESNPPLRSSPAAAPGQSEDSKNLEDSDSPDNLAISTVPSLLGSVSAASGVFTLLELPELPESAVPAVTSLPSADADCPSARIGKAMHRLLERGIFEKPESESEPNQKFDVPGVVRCAASPHTHPHTGPTVDLTANSPLLATVPNANANITATATPMATRAEVFSHISPSVAKIAREFSLTPEQLNQARSIASRIRYGQGAWAWNAEVLAWQGNEVELAHAGQTLRLDRLVQRKDPGHAGHWWVLDYKSANQPERQPALLAQLRLYRAAVQLIYPGAVVAAAFLTADGAVIAE